MYIYIYKVYHRHVKNDVHERDLHEVLRKGGDDDTKWSCENISVNL